jgi:hypothetical protein
MAVVNVGTGLTIGVVMPGIYPPFLLAVGDLQARINACLAFSAQVSLSFAAQLTLAASIIANIEAAVTAGLSPPTISAQLSIMAALLVTLEAQLAVMLAVPFATAGIDVWAVDGTASDVGTQWAIAVASGFPSGGGPSAPANVLILGTTLGATWTDMSAVFKVTP